MSQPSAPASSRCAPSDAYDVPATTLHLGECVPITRAPPSSPTRAHSTSTSSMHRCARTTTPGSSPSATRPPVPRPHTAHFRGHDPIHTAARRRACPRLEVSARDGVWPSAALALPPPRRSGAVGSCPLAAYTRPPRQRPTPQGRRLPTLPRPCPVASRGIGGREGGAAGRYAARRCPRSECSGAQGGAGKGPGRRRGAASGPSTSCPWWA